MSVSPADRWVAFFVLEGSWLLCVLQVADTPLLAGSTSSIVASILCLGAVGIAVALLVAARAGHRATRLCRGVGIVVFAGGLLVSVTSSGATAGGVVLMGLGLVLAVTGMQRRRRSTASRT